MSAFIAYLRVSTVRQGESGLGLEAQREAVIRHVRSVGGVITGEFVEVESGKRNERPELARALAQAGATGATLIVAKLDRLARDVSFIARLMEGSVPFVAVDQPHANRLVLHILAAVGEAEGRAISERTRAALSAARSRGVKLGGFRGHRPPAAQSEGARAAYSEQARGRAEALRGLVGELREAGITSARDVAKALNSRGVRAARGGAWGPGQAQRLLAALA